MTRTKWSGAQEFLLKASDHGIIRVSTLTAMGMPAGTVTRQCRPGGSWQLILPGVVCLFRAPPSWRQMLAAAVAYGSPDALITGLAACRGHGLRNIPRDRLVHILIDHERRLKDHDFVFVERTRRMPEVVRREGVALAPATRAVLDAARRMRELEPVRALLTESVQRRFSTVDRLEQELAAGSGRGSAIVRRVLREMEPGAHSVAEIDATYVWSRSGLPPPLWNKRLVNAQGDYIAKPDAWFDEVGLAWEIDSLAFHSGADGFVTTVRRDNKYAIAGVQVLRTLPTDLRSAPRAVIAELRAAYAAAASRPRPDVKVVD
ncbi:hypothetical protein [Amycolatopsis sp. NPDC059657]|uniref:hypothetical protein n=1 Tax=Amycolatopsis sp. NPDC059657 TaxID=3346899 RepID=UPI0036714538